MKTLSLLSRFLMFFPVVILIGGMSAQAHAQSEEGIELYKYWEYEKAEAALRLAVKKDPADIEAGYYLGLSLLMQGKYQDALDTLQKVKGSVNSSAKMETVKPDRGQVEIALTRAYLGLDNYPEALKALKAAEKANADPVDLHTFRAAYYIKEGTLEEADEEMTKAIDLDSRNPYTFYFGGIIQLRLGKPERAVQMFEAFLELAPFAPEAERAKILIDSLC